MGLVRFPDGRILARSSGLLQVYHVGRSKLTHWINAGRVRPPYFGWYPRRGDWLVAYCVAGEVCLSGAYRDYHSACCCAQLDMRAGRDAEVWMVNEDSLLYFFCPVCRRLIYDVSPHHVGYSHDRLICWDCFIDSL